MGPPEWVCPNNVTVDVDTKLSRAKFSSCLVLQLLTTTTRSHPTTQLLHSWNGTPKLGEWNNSAGSHEDGLAICQKVNPLVSAAICQICLKGHLTFHFSVAHMDWFTATEPGDKICLNSGRILYRRRVYGAMKKKGTNMEWNVVMYTQCNVAPCISIYREKLMNSLGLKSFSVNTVAGVQSTN